LRTCSILSLRIKLTMKFVVRLVDG
jgi:hypothetical protein